ncbi:MAG: HlyD family efflux transporter periplasmic adaptor subunit [Oscillospiraceae bacterium]|nr:HlyD family efflux transporter periplasmic adaptor subunit [Oscillospiraceae bacterium]
MNDNTVKNIRKDMIKNVAIIFLSILLVLTFFSNTIMNYSLPQVSTTSANQGTISEQIKGSGAIEPAEKYELMMEETRDIKDVLVKQGDTIKAGDPIYELEGSESTELTDAQNELDKLKFEYRKEQLKLSPNGYANEVNEIEKEESALESMERTLSDLESQLSSAENKTDKLSSASEDLRELKAEGEKLKSERDRLDAALKSVDTDDMLDLTGSDYDRLSRAKQKVKDAEDASTKAQDEYKKVTEKYGSEKNQSETISEKQNEIYDLQRSNERLYNKIAEADSSAETDTSVWSDQIDQNNDKITKLTREISDLQTKNIESVAAKNKIDKAEKAQQKAADAVTAAKKELAEETRKIKLDLKKKINELDEKIRVNTSLTTDAENDKKDAEDEGLLTAAKLREKIKEQEKSIDDQKLKIKGLRDALTAKQKSDSTTIESSGIDLEEKALAIEKAEAKLEKIKEKSSKDSYIYAKKGGVVDQLNFTAGSKAEKGSAAATIVVTDLGYVLEIPVKSEQARKVRVGDAAEITGWNWSNLKATLKEIQPDSKNPQTNKLLVFRVEGDDLSTGQQVSIALGSKGQSYSAVVPKSAVRDERGGGKYVLVEEVKSSPLGNRYFARKYDVKVVASDDLHSAIEGLSGGELIITSSNRPINPGSQVRPAENG